MTIPSRVVFLCVLAASSLVFTAEPRQIENRRLTWTDFRGTPETDRPYDAYTYWSVHYSYDAPTRDGDGFRLIVRVWNQLDDRSWVKAHVLKDPNNGELLDHEQGHYTLGVLCALEFKKVASRNVFGAHYHVEIRSLFDQILNKYVDLEKVYDAETGHMWNREGQKAWDQRLARMVNERWGDR
jgi:hypothetical protein